MLLCQVQHKACSTVMQQQHTGRHNPLLPPQLQGMQSGISAARSSNATSCAWTGLARPEPYPTPTPTHANPRSTSNTTPHTVANKQLPHLPWETLPFSQCCQHSQHPLQADQVQGAQPLAPAAPSTSRESGLAQQARQILKQIAASAPDPACSKEPSVSYEITTSPFIEQQQKQGNVTLD